MKKSISATFFIVVLLFAFSISVNAQKKFKGVINYNISYSGTIDAATAAQQPKLMVLSIYENLQKMNLPLGPVNIDVVTNGDAKTTTTMLDIMGEKKYFKLSTEDIEKKIAEKPIPDIKYLDETKTIAGYVCKKAEYTEKSDDGTTSTATVYYTEELGGEALNYGGQFYKLKGVPLEYVIASADGIITTFAASEVKKGKVKDTDFLIPSDYVEMTAEEKAQMMKQFEGEE
jgi:GLPGLI family protein